MSQKWQEHFNCGGVANEKELRTASYSTLLSISNDDSHLETRPLSLFIFSSWDMSSRLADGGEPPVARMEHASVLYGRLRSRSKPDLDPVQMEHTEERRLEFDRE